MYAAYILHREIGMYAVLPQIKLSTPLGPGDIIIISHHCENYDSRGNIIAIGAEIAVVFKLVWLETMIPLAVISLECSLMYSASAEKVRTLPTRSDTEETMEDLWLSKLVMMSS